MNRPDEEGIIGTRRRPERADDLPLFAQAGAGSNATATPAVPASVLPKSTSTFWELEAKREAQAARERLASIPFPTPSDFAALAASSDVAEKLLALAERVANAILDATGRVTVWEVRYSMHRLGLLANDGEESLDCLGALGRRMGLVAIGSERPPALPELGVTHQNRNTIWARRGERHGAAA